MTRQGTEPTDMERLRGIVDDLSDEEVDHLLWSWQDVEGRVEGPEGGPPVAKDRTPREQLRGMIDSLSDERADILSCIDDRLSMHDGEGGGEELELDPSPADECELGEMLAAELREERHEFQTALKVAKHPPATPPLFGDAIVLDRKRIAEHVRALFGDASAANRKLMAEQGRAGDTTLDDMRVFLPDLVEGKCIRPRGRKRPSLDKVLVQAYWADRVRCVLRDLKRHPPPGTRTRYAIALKQVAKESGHSERKLDRWCSPSDSEDPYAGFRRSLARDLQGPARPFYLAWMEQQVKQGRTLTDKSS